MNRNLPITLLYWSGIVGMAIASVMGLFLFPQDSILCFEVWIISGGLVFVAAILEFKAPKS